jgi:hypothetical protein
MVLLEKYKELALVLDGRQITEPMEISFVSHPLAEQLATIALMQMRLLMEEDDYEKFFSDWHSEEWLNSHGLLKSYNQEVHDEICSINEHCRVCDSGWRR